MSGARARALSLYRRIIRAARTWEGQESRESIRQEAAALFRQHRGVADPAEVEAKVKEGEDRLQIALHYGIASPRLHHASQFRKRDLEVPIIK